MAGKYRLDAKSVLSKAIYTAAVKIPSPARPLPIQPDLLKIPPNLPANPTPPAVQRQNLQAIPINFPQTDLNAAPRAPPEHRQLHPAQRISLPSKDETRFQGVQPHIQGPRSSQVPQPEGLGLGGEQKDGRGRMLPVGWVREGIWLL